jgi:DNA-directed RNA polymerase beta subunit
VCSQFDELPKEFHELVWKNIANVIDWRGVFNQCGDAIIYDPVTGTYLESPMTIGYPTYLKLMQEADEKLNVRAGVLEEQYSRTNSQPQKGDNSAKGQRMAEMELMALASAGASSFIDEILNEKSDNTGRMLNNHLRQLNLPGSLPDYCCDSRAVLNMLYYCEALGVKIELPKDIVDLDISRFKYSLNLPKLISRHTTVSNKQSETTSHDEYSTSVLDMLPE